MFDICLHINNDFPFLFTSYVCVLWFYIVKKKNTKSTCISAKRLGSDFSVENLNKILHYFVSISQTGRYPILRSSICIQSLIFTFKYPFLFKFFSIKTLMCKWKTEYKKLRVGLGY